MIRQAVILVGGTGSRLGEITRSFPKPFLAINGQPFVARLLRRLAQHGIDQVILLAGHAANQIEQLDLPTPQGLKVDILVEPSPQGTAGGLKIFAPKLADKFLLLNGDSILDSNWSALVPMLTDTTAMVMALRRVEDVSRYGSVRLTENAVTAFNEKKPGGGAGYINAGIYAIDKNHVLPHIAGPSSLETEVIPKLVAAGQVKAVPQQGYFIDIGLPETLQAARDQLDNNLQKPAVIFDRDNTLVEDYGYTHKIEDLKWRDGAREAIRMANDANFYVFVATNQAGIARGYYTAKDMQNFHQAMQRELQIIGAHIDDFAYCPHHPDGKVAPLNTVCGCRKPASGMLESLHQKHPFVRECSIMIGDQPKDAEAGQAFGIRGVMLQNQALLPVVEAAIRKRMPL